MTPTVEDTGSHSHIALYRHLACLVMLTLATPLTHALGSPIYELTGELDWITTTGADRLMLHGQFFAMTFEITDPTPNNVADPNGTQSEYQGVGTLSLGGTPIDIATSFGAFFHSNSAMNDVANFSLTPVSGDPTFYSPAANLMLGSNAGAAIAPPIYPAGEALTAFLVVPGVDPSVASDNAVYSLLGFQFTVFQVAPEPATFLLLGLGWIGIRALRRR